jgi:hypothetical protein
MELLYLLPTFSRNSLPSSSGGEVGGNGCWYLCTNLHSNLKHVLSIDLGWCNSGQCETMFGTGTSTGYSAVYQLIPHMWSQQFGWEDWGKNIYRSLSGLSQEWMNSCTEFNPDIFSDPAHIISNLSIMFNPMKHGANYEPPAVTLRNSPYFHSVMCFIWFSK